MHRTFRMLFRRQNGVAMRLLGGAVLVGLVLSGPVSGQVSFGETETRSGFVASSLNESADLYLITLSESETDGPVRVAYLMKVDPAANLPRLRGLADVEHKGELSVLIKSKDKQIGSVFYSKDAKTARAPQAKHIAILGLQRLGIDARYFPNHADTAAKVFALPNIKNIIKP